MLRSNVNTLGLPVTDPDNIALANEFCLMAKRNVVQGMRDFLHTHPGFNICTPIKGFTALHFACKDKSLEAALFLIEHGAALTKRGDTPKKSAPIDLCEDPNFIRAIAQNDRSFSDMSDKQVLAEREKLLEKMLEERKNRTQLGELNYEHEVVFSGDSKYNQNKVNAILYAITGEDFRLLRRVVPVDGGHCKHTYDAFFEWGTGLAHVALTIARLPHEYVHAKIQVPANLMDSKDASKYTYSKFIVVPDIDSPEVISSLEAYYKNPLNRYTQDDLIVKTWLKDQKKGEKIDFSSLPKQLLNKYYAVIFSETDGCYDHAAKTDAASMTFFKSQEHKFSQLSLGNIRENYERLSRMARASLAKSFPTSRPIKVIEAELMSNDTPSRLKPS